jgi:cytochrome P450
MLIGSASVFLSVFSVSMTNEDIVDFFVQARSTFAALQYRSWHTPDTDALQRLESSVSDLVSRFANTLDRSPGAEPLLADWKQRGQSIERFSPLHEFMMNFFAGVETTTSALCWAIDRVGVNAAVQERICDAMRAGDPSYLECFLDETLRYFPPIPFIVRRATKETTLGRREIAKGQLLMVSVVGVHRDPAFWEEPLAFNSARDAFLRRSYDRRAFIPFLTGPRTCGGARLARLELTEGFKAFLARHAVRTERPEIAFRYNLALRPAGWSSVSVRRRG